MVQVKKFPKMNVKYSLGEFLSAKSLNNPELHKHSALKWVRIKRLTFVSSICISFHWTNSDNTIKGWQNRGARGAKEDLPPQFFLEISK